VDERRVNFSKASVRDMAAILALFQSELARRPNELRIEECLTSFPSQIAASEHGDLVGFAYSTRVAPDILELLNIVVKRNWRNQGIGGELLTRIEAMASPYKVIVLYNSGLYENVDEKRDPTDFYQRHGYVAFSLTDNTKFFWKKLYERR
jgi:N-acetylglutamate synthase-like GNAT family acetyltransferase